ncbi:MAG: response regulator [Opitutae bacterium]|nr:response regulator [Opitutae bacterium]
MEETFPRNLTIEHHASAGVWNVVADATQLHQVLLNLCVNARDAMPAGGRLSLTAENRQLEAAETRFQGGAEPGPYVVLTVADTGCGIAPEITSKIFDPFFTTKPPGIGTGLGLATVMDIVVHYNGFVTVDSEPGRGTTFRVHLPATAIAADATPSTPAAPITAGRNELILIVDDEASIRETLQLILEGHRYRVLTAVNGEEAIKCFLLHRGEVRAVVADVMMPVMGGVEMIHALRILEPGLRVIATSGLEQANACRDMAALGVTEFLAKPVTPLLLMGAIARVLAKSASETRASPVVA